MNETHVDVLIMGAGLSGIGAACHLAEKCPEKSVALLESRDRMGGTWDLFRYPGIRSDSDMHTLGYKFRPWKEKKSIADGPSILKYIRETAEEHGISDKIRYNHKVIRADWSSETATWTVEVRKSDTDEITHLTCSFLLSCAGYYRYDQGFRPDFPGEDQFQGQIIHPQHWPEDLDYSGKRVVIIGSGATAVTLGPSMAADAERVTILQRSPTYVVSRPGEDKISQALRKVLPEKAAYGLTRWKNVLMSTMIWNRCQKAPEKVKAFLIDQVREELGPDYDIDTHFTPRYDPWNQRLCLIPDGDMFQAIREGLLDMVTDQIETFTPNGIRLQSGQELEADIVVTATGLEMEFLGGISVNVDGRAVNPEKLFTYKGMMYSNVPNLASVFGYLNASWTLRADLVSEYVCKLINHMDKTGQSQATPHPTDPAMQSQPLYGFSSGYLKRAVDRMPRQGPRRPWRQNQSYFLDIMDMRFSSVDDGEIRFSKPAPAEERIYREAAE